MDAAHLHLVLNHAPLFGVLFGALGLAVALARRSDDIARLSLGLLLLAGLLAVPTFFTGEGAEESVEAVGGIPDGLLDAHEEAGEIAAIAAGLLGLVALVLLLAFRRGPVPRAVLLLSLVGALGVAGWIGYTANLGGQLRHPEIRDGTTAVAAPNDHEHDD